MKFKKIQYKGVKCITAHCVLCDKPGCGAALIPNTPNFICYDCPGGQRKYNLIDISRKIENLPNASDEEILTLLRKQLNLNVVTQKDETDISKMLDKFEARHWAIVPCAKNDKRPIQKEWQKIENRDKVEWFHWLNNGLNIGVRTGQVSNLCILDFDFYTPAEKCELVKETTTPARLAELKARKVISGSLTQYWKDTLVQETLGGYHVFYQATDLPKGKVVLEGIRIDIESEGGQVIIPPSPQVAVTEEYQDGVDEKQKPIIKERVVGYGHRKFLNDNDVVAMPKELYDLIVKSKVKKPELPLVDAEQEEIAVAISTEDFKIKDLTNNRKNTLIKLGGLFQKKMNITQVANVLDILNGHLLEQPLPYAEVKDVVNSLAKYIGNNEAELAQSVLDYLTETDIATKTEIESVVYGQRVNSENKKRLDRTLANLILEHKITKYNSRNYKIIKQMTWREDFEKMGTPINFKMPYINDYAHFNRGDIIIIGAQNKVGKTTLAVNFLKRLIKQGIKPGYFYNESGGRFGKSAMRLDIKPGDFEFTRAINPLEVILKPNQVCIYDWIRPVDFARTADIFDSLVQKLEEANSIMIGFVQLRDDNSWFAKDLINQFVSTSVKYIYDDKDGVNTHMELSNVRDRKSNGKNFLIPCKYFEESREVRTVEEIEEEERAIAQKTAQEQPVKEEPKSENP